MLRDESRLEGWADYIACPLSVEELIISLKEAAALGLQVTIQGAATGVVGGCVSQGGVLLSLKNMNRILGYREAGGDDYLRVQAGVTFSEISEYLAKHKGKSLFFPPNPTEKNATLGGAFACDSSGMNVLHYGSVSAWVSEIAWVLPDGRLWKIERGEFVFDDRGCLFPDGSFSELAQFADSPRVLAQYPHPGLDLIDFLAGSEGRLGVLAELELRLLPICRENWGVLFFFGQNGQGATFGNVMYSTIADAGGECFISGCEYFDEGALLLLRKGREQLSHLARMPQLPAGAREAVFVTISGTDGDIVETCLVQMLELFIENGGREENAWAVGSLRELEQFQALHHGILELINMELDTVRKSLGNVVKCALDARVPPNGLQKFVLTCQEQAKKVNMPIFSVAHIPIGQVHINLIPQKAGDIEQCNKLIDDWSLTVLKAGGHLATENGIGKNKRKQVLGYLTSEQREYYKKLEQHFDGQNRMQNSFMSLWCK